MRRREFPAAVKRDAYERSGGVCECHRIWRTKGCGARLTTGNVFYEHITCDGIGGHPTLDNCAVLSKTCWLKKTNGYDKPVVAKGKRVRDLNRGIRQSFYRPLIGTKRSGIKLQMVGRPIDRRTGLPWRPGS